MLTNSFNIADLPNSILRDIYQYWLKMKADHPLPFRVNLDPLDIVELLPHINLINVEHNTGRYKMKVIGNETVKAMGIDVTGKYLDDFPFIDGLLKERYDWLTNEKLPYFNYDKLKWSSKSFLEYYSLGLPISRNGKDVDILMIGIYYQFPKEKRTEFYGSGL